MKYIVSILLLFISYSLSATEPTDVSMIGLNGHVKFYEKEGESFYFDKSGNLIKATRCYLRSHGGQSKTTPWNEYYLHINKQDEKRIKTLVYEDSTFNKLLYYTLYRYDDNDDIWCVVGDESGRNYYTSKTFNVNDNKCQNVLSKYGKKKHKPNSVIIHKIKCQTHKHDTAYCTYNEKGELENYRLQCKTGYGEKIKEEIFKEDTLAREHYKNENSSDPIERWSKHTSVWDSKGHLIEYKEESVNNDEIYMEQYKHNKHGLLEEKRRLLRYNSNGKFSIAIPIYHKHYPWESYSKNIDCTIKYRYDNLNNLIGEDYYDNITKESHIQDYIIEFY